MNLNDLTWPEAGALIERTTIGVITCGATEQHGPHLPLGTDTIGCWALAERLAARRPLVLVPPIPVGCSDNQMPWPGSLSLRVETLAALVFDLAGSLHRHGLRNFLLISGHAGNRIAFDLAATRIESELNARTIIVYFPSAAYEAGAGRFDQGHAGRIQTAAVMAVAPHLVHLDRAAGGDDIGEANRRQREFSARDIYRPLLDWREVSPSGWYGDALGATAAEGSELLDLTAARVSSYVDKVFGS